eukprot:gene10970-11125_t
MIAFPQAASAFGSDSIDASAALWTTVAGLAKEKHAAAAATVQPKVPGAVANNGQGMNALGAGGEAADGNAAAAIAAAVSSPAPVMAEQRKPPKVLADLVESLVAAVFVDSGGCWEDAWRVVEHFLYRGQQGSKQLLQETALGGVGQGGPEPYCCGVYVLPGHPQLKMVTFRGRGW